VTGHEPFDDGTDPLARRLRGDPAGDEAYRPGRFAVRIETALSGPPGARAPLAGARVTSPFARAIGPWATATLIVALVGLILVRGGSGPGRPVPSAADLLLRVNSAGAIRIAVRPDRPQARIPGGTFAGFDLDVAAQLGARLGVRDDIVLTTATEMLASPTGAWDIALLSAPLGNDATSRFAVSAPYYYWPHYLIAPAALPAPRITDLDGSTICAVAGGVGQRWLIGDPLGVGAEVRSMPPTRPTVMTEADDATCLADVEAGRADAMVGEALTTADLALRPRVRIVGSAPAVVEARSVVAARSGSDPTSLVSAVNAAIAELRADGTLQRLSSNRFGGQDLSAPPR
jgi:cystine transport system substrate-binding protein